MAYSCSLASTRLLIGVWFLAWGSLIGDSPAGEYQDRLNTMRRLAEEGPNEILRERLEPHWLGDSSAFWYRAERSKDSYEFIWVVPSEGIRRPAFDHAALARSLSKERNQPVEPERLPITHLETDGQTFRFSVDQQSFAWNSVTGELQRITEQPTSEAAPVSPVRQRRPRRSSRPRMPATPSGKETFVKDHNLWLREAGQERALTSNGQPENFYEPHVVWSPTGQSLIAWQTTPGERHQVHLVESRPKDQLQPKLISFDYHKPGDRLPVSRPVVIHVDTSTVQEISKETMPLPWSIDYQEWSTDGQRAWFLYNERGHQKLSLIEVRIADGAARVLIEETSPTFIDYAHKQHITILPSTDEVVWMSERSGWNHLYLLKLSDGSVIRPLTSGPWVVRSVDRVDVEQRALEIQFSGQDPDQDPYHTHYGRVDLDSGHLTTLTNGDGEHQLEWSPDRKWIIDTYSRVDSPPVMVLRNAETGAPVCDLETADVQGLLALGWRMPERFVAKGRDGVTDIWGVIYRPAHFDPAQKYPVVEQIYAGPQGAFVPKAFSASHQAQRLAELGFITVQIDGMGTSHRSKAFHDVCWKNLGDSGFPDRIAWLKAAALHEPAIDLTRVGIYGGSAGGQSALRAVLAHGDFYHVAVADCGCHDNRMDKVWWNELWMGYPIGEHYSEQSNITQAHRLTGKLLLIVGELDQNVDPASTMQVVAALVEADKDFDLLVLPGVGHGAAETPYGDRKRREFLVRHLLKLVPTAP